MQPNTQQQQPTPKDFFEQAKRLLSVGDVFEASKRAGKLRAHFPEEPPILAIHGFTLAKLGAHGPAIADMRKSSKLTLQSLEDGDEEDQSRPRVVDQYVHLQTEIGRSLTALGEFEDAMDEIELAIAMDPDRADTVSAKAELLCAMGQHDEAVALIEDGIARKLDEIPLMIGMSKVLDASPKADEARMKSCSEKLGIMCDEVGLGAGELMSILRAHGTMCDRIGDYTKAYNSFRRAAKLRRGGYNPEMHAKITSKIIEQWTADGIAKLVRPDGEMGARRVLLAGSSKSGMPEVEALLERLPDAIAVGPIESLGMICMSGMNSAKGVLRGVVPTPSGHRGDQLAKLAGTYSQHCDAAARIGGMITIDSHPHNLPLMGCVAAGLRGVRIINCRRDPIEHALAIYCDEMAGNHPYAGDLMAAAAYVKDCDRMMDHWIKVLNDERIGAKVIDVQYEQVKNDPAAVLRQLGEALGVEVSDDMTAGLEGAPAKGPGSHASEYGSANKMLREFFADA
tara:strand:- start:337885 stop:339414 length:1530 start_codon:yes stop_codon:yes gene_type:complete